MLDSFKSFWLFIYPWYHKENKLIICTKAPAYFYLANWTWYLKILDQDLVCTNTTFYGSLKTFQVRWLTLGLAAPVLAWLPSQTSWGKERVKLIQRNTIRESNWGSTARYTAYTVDTVCTVHTIQTTLHCLNSSMYAYIDC